MTNSNDWITIDSGSDTPGLIAEIFGKRIHLVSHHDGQTIELNQHQASQLLYFLHTKLYKLDP